MTKLTAYNRDVQKYMQGNELSSKRKSTIIEQIEKAVHANGTSFERMFPSRSKRKDVLDHIVYLLSGNGICKIAATTLAEKADCSVRTVNAAVKDLKATGKVIVAGLADGKNKYVFVLKSHENFKSIMEEVFYIDAEQIAQQDAEQVAEQKNAESLEPVSAEGEKPGSNYNNSFISSNNLFKQEKDSIRESIENEFKSVSSTQITEEEAKRVSTYYTNDYQFNLYHSIKGGQYTPDMKLNASVLGLRLGSNCTLEDYKCAIKVIYKMDRHIANGGYVDSIPALFSDLYATEIKVYQYNLKQQEGANTSVSEGRSVPTFYNWLEN